MERATMNRVLIALVITALAAGHCLAQSPTIKGASSAYQPLFASGVVSGNGADLTEDTFSTCNYTLPAGMLANVGDTLQIVATGTFAASADTKTIRIRLAAGIGNAFLQESASTTTRWGMDYRVIKTGPSTQSWAVFGGSNFIPATGAPFANGTSAVTDTSAIAITVSGQNTTNSVLNSLTCQYFSVTYIKAPGT
jgi:hypothetical protein